MKRAIFSCMCAICLLLSMGGAQVPSTKDAKPGGRHGKFHFATDEQLAADANRRAQIRTRLTDLRRDLANVAKDEQAKRRLLLDIIAFERFVDTVEEHTTKPASVAAAQAEVILNEKKGMSHCTFCHEGAEPSRVLSRTSTKR